MTTSSRTAEKWCIACFLLKWKCKLLPDDGDWLFSSGRTCAKHPNIPENMNDLDSHFMSCEETLEAFHDVTDPEGRKLLYEHAKGLYQASERKQGIVRDKAKQLLGSTSFTLSLISASLVFLQNWQTDIPFWPTCLLLVMFSWAATHFLRSLVLSIRAITRDETIDVSTQQVIKALTGNKELFENGLVYLRLAADLKSSTAQTNQRLLDRINQVIIAQTSFRWGITILPAVFLAYIIMVLSYADRAQPIEQLKKDVDAQFIENNNALEKRLQLIDQTLVGNQANNKRIWDSIDKEVAVLKSQIDSIFILEKELQILRNKLRVSNKDMQDTLQAIESKMHNLENQLNQISTSLKMLVKITETKIHKVGNGKKKKNGKLETNSNN